MAHRRIRGLRFAQSIARPEGLPAARPRGCKLDGLYYERQVAKAVPWAIPGAWFEFTDLNGHGKCQTDLIFGYRAGDVRELFCLEVKLSLVEDGFDQLELLYLPVLRHCYQVPTYGIQVTKNLRGAGRAWGKPPIICSSLGDAMHQARQGKRVAWHWLGADIVGTLVTPFGRRPLDTEMEVASS